MYPEKCVEFDLPSHNTCAFILNYGYFRNVREYYYLLVLLNMKKELSLGMAFLVFFMLISERRRGRAVTLAETSYLGATLADCSVYMCKQHEGITNMIEVFR